MSEPFSRSLQKRIEAQTGEKIFTKRDLDLAVLEARIAAYDDCARHRCPHCRGGHKPKWLGDRVEENKFFAQGMFHQFTSGDQLCHAQHERFQWADLQKQKAEGRSPVRPPNELIKK